MFPPSVKHLTRAELERQYVGALLENSRLKSLRHTYKDQITNMNAALRLRNLQLELLRQQLESQVCIVEPYDFLKEAQGS